jgi:hypothetical protein
MNCRKTAMILALVLVAQASLLFGAQTLPHWQMPDDVSVTAFALGGGKGQYRSWGRGEDYRVFFREFLPALFERTLVLEEYGLAGGQLEWIFTGRRGGLTVVIKEERVAFQQRFYDSFAFNEIANGGRRHPEYRTEPKPVQFRGRLQAVTVRMDHKLGLSAAVNGRTFLQRQYLLDVSRHQLRLTQGKGELSGKMLSPKSQTASVRVNSAKRHQAIVGFGGIATPTAYGQLSDKGKHQWWQFICEYNLLIQREYPIGTQLNRQMDNWDRLADATPHYYGDNFPNGEVSDFDYIKTLRRLGGKVWFEFWALPPWVGTDAGKYAEAMVRYCRASQQKAGAPPDIVGIQNEVGQSTSMFHEMTLALRRKLDEAGFGSVRIHMSDSGTVAGGIKRARQFLSSKQAWAAIDYSATHMYDYQGFFVDPDGFDARLAEWTKLTDDKPFLSTELCINSDKYQLDSYRLGLAMGQLYHKNLVLCDAVAVCYCWTLLNVVQPSYGWTRSLFVPDRAHGFVPMPSSNQLRVFGAYSRRVREGMVRIEATADVEDLLVSAFSGEGGAATIVLLNRSTKPRRVRVLWPGVTFAQMEIVDPYHENEIQPLGDAPARKSFGLLTEGGEMTIEPGAIVTLTNVVLGKLPEDFTIASGKLQ